MDREESCEIGTRSTRGARSGSRTTWNLKQGVRGWSGDVALKAGVGGHWRRWRESRENEAKEARNQTPRGHYS
jgi:hypothetical protein